MNWITVYGLLADSGKCTISLVKVSGMTRRNVCLEKGENALVSGELTEPENWENEMEVLLVGTNFQREQLFSESQSFQGTVDITVKGCTEPSTALAASPAFYTFHYSIWDLYTVYSCFSHVASSKFLSKTKDFCKKIFADSNIYRFGNNGMMCYDIRYSQIKYSTLYHHQILSSNHHYCKINIFL